MKNILLHGLGQKENSWSIVSKNLKKQQIETISLNLFQMTHQKTYPSLQKEFTKYCNSQKEKLNLCGLSLGGILALNYAKENPDKVKSLILIGIPYQIPKILFQIQYQILKITPKKVFEKLGISKKDFCQLLHSMKTIKIQEKIEQISCPCLILCGNLDKINKKSARKLAKKIKHSTLQWIPNSSHESNMDNPMELSKLIANFWKNNNNNY